MFSYSFISFIYFIRLFYFILFLFFILFLLFYFFLLLSAVRRLIHLSRLFILYVYFVLFYFYFFILLLLSAVRRPPSAIRRPPSAVRIRTLQSPFSLLRGKSKDTNACSSTTQGLISWNAKDRHRINSLTGDQRLFATSTMRLVDCLQCAFSLKIGPVLISSSAIANHDVII